MNAYPSLATPTNTRRIAGRSTSHRISLNDRIYVKLMLNGVTLLETVRDNIADYTSLLAVLREAGNKYKGLARMFVRNISRGWSIQKPLLLASAQYDESAIRPGYYPAPWQTH